MDAPPVVALRLAGVSKTFDGVPVLRGVDVEVRPGRVHALLGGNGSGKSTTLKVVAGVYTADPGGTIDWSLPPVDTQAEPLPATGA